MRNLLKKKGVLLTQNSSYYGARNALRPSAKGSTLIEILIYFIILAIFLLAATTFAIQIMDVNDTSQSLGEMEANREFISEKITDAIYAADSISSTGSTFDNDNGILALHMTQGADSPTKFYLSEGNIYMQEGTGTAVQINTNDVKLDYLRFNQVSYSKTPDQIIIDAQISPISTEMAHLQNTILMHLTASLRQ
jgi:Tfp pilus assembly protein PilV